MIISADPPEANRRADATVPTAVGPTRVAVLLVPGFAMMSHASALEPLRAANVLAGKELYHWRHLSPDGLPVSPSVGVTLLVDGGLSALDEVDLVLVCAGGNPAHFEDHVTFAWLRAAARRGITLAGISGGPYILAKAGLLDGHRATVHWEHAPAFAEAFPAVKLVPSLYEIDRRRLTSAGGVAALDMMHEVIGEAHGYDLARAVGDWFLQAHARPGSGVQRLGAAMRYGIRHAKLEAIVVRLEKRLDAPADRPGLAAWAGLSERQLDRLFASHLGTSAQRFHLGLRLDRARDLLRQTSLSVLDVAVVTGFQSASHFSRAYRARFGMPPRAERMPAPGGHPSVRA